MAFIVLKAYNAHAMLMRGYILTFLGCAAIIAPEAAFARDVDQSESVTCTDPKHRHTVLRPLTEPAPVRKKENVRVRRVLM